MKSSFDCRIIFIVLLFFTMITGLFLFFLNADGYPGLITISSGVSTPSGDATQGVHYSFAGTQRFFDDIFTNTLPVEIAQEKNISALIVNHHLLAPTLISQTFQSVSHLQPSVVVLISPNHFGIGSAPILTSGYNWETQYGILLVNNPIVERMQQLPRVARDERPFEREHGIANVVTFIKKNVLSKSSRAV